MYTAEVPGVLPTSYKETHCDYVWYTAYNDEGGYGYTTRMKWMETVPVDEGTNTIMLTGLRRGTSYRVGFRKSGAPCEDIPYERLVTRGKCDACHAEI